MVYISMSALVEEGVASVLGISNGELDCPAVRQSNVCASLAACPCFRCWRVNTETLHLVARLHSEKEAAIKTAYAALDRSLILVVTSEGPRFRESGHVYQLSKREGGKVVCAWLVVGRSPLGRVDLLPNLLL